jgi:hypothetical protein
LIQRNLWTIVLIGADLRFLRRGFLNFILEIIKTFYEAIVCVCA